jgi:hypothetical protein
VERIPIGFDFFVAMGLLEQSKFKERFAMSLDLESLQQPLTDALTRLERLEQRAEDETAPRWQFLVARASVAATTLH